MVEETSFQTKNESTCKDINRTSFDDGNVKVVQQKKGHQWWRGRTTGVF